MATNSLETLSSELFDNILIYITTQHDLNSLSRTSKTLYHRTTPSLYRTWSYHGLQQEVQPLRQFLETLNWRPDLAAHVKELDTREWGNCPILSDYEGDCGENYEKRIKLEEEVKKEKERDTLMNDAIFGDEDRESDEIWEDSEEDDEEMEDVEMDDEEEEIGSDELAFLGPILPFSHGYCDKNECKNSDRFAYQKAGLDFERKDIIVDYAVILEEEDEDKLIVLLLSKLPNLQTLYMVMPEVYFESCLKDNALCKFLDNTSDLAASGVLQKLETLYICSPMYPGGKDHREYDMELRRLFPFMRLPNMRSLYTLTAHMYWSEWPKPPVDFTTLKHTSNISTLSYDEGVLAAVDVINSLQMFKALKSFRWTAGSTCFAHSPDFIGIQKSLSEALSMHQETLEELYIDIRHNDPKNDARKRVSNNDILFGSLKTYPELRNLAIDATSLCGHQNWTPAPFPLLDILPSNLESLTLFAKVVRIGVFEGSVNTAFENQLWYAHFLHLIPNAPSKLRHLRVCLTRDLPPWRQPAIDPEIFFPSSLLQEAEMVCAEKGILFESYITPDINIEEKRTDGYTTIPYFLEQIKGRNPGRDF